MCEQGGRCPCSRGLSWIPIPISSLQSPQLAVPEGCRGRPGAQVKKHLVLVRMLSCRCQAQTSKTVPLGKKLNLSGATYDLNVLAKTRFGRSTIQKWHLPAQELTGVRVAGTGA
jgi:interleukin 12 receptor beta-1